MKRLITLAAVLLSFALPLLAADYKTTKLNGFGPNAINSSGEIAGFIILPNQSDAALWTRSGGIQDLGALGGTNSDARALNDAGQIVGQANLTGDTASHAFLWTQGAGMQDLGALTGTQSYATAINASGQVVGQWFSPQTQFLEPFIWTPNGGMKDLGSPLGGLTLVAGINSAGHVALTSYSPDGAVSRAYLWTPETGALLLDSLGNASTAAYSITGFDAVAGTAGSHAAVWLPAGAQDLGTLGGLSSLARQIGSSGVVVGQSQLAGNKVTHSFIWTVPFGMQDLGQLPNHPNNSPESINAKGQVVGFSGGSGTYFWSLDSGMKSVTALQSPAGLNDAGQIIGTTRNKSLQGAIATPIMHVAIASSQNPSQVGQSVTFTATVTSIAGQPPDEQIITFKDGSKVIGTAPLFSGIASLTTSSLAAGSHLIKATYTGDDNYASSKSPVFKQVVNP